MIRFWISLFSDSPTDGTKGARRASLDLHDCGRLLKTVGAGDQHVESGHLAAMTLALIDVEKEQA
jgi:hypothetical protein